MKKLLKLCEELISKPSITPDDAGCQKLLTERLAPLGFSIHTISSNGVTNLWARRGTEAPLFAFVGHTDVVPPGPLEKWTSPPFEPTVRDGFLYGRGAADMKGSIAAMVIACENFIRENPNHRGSIGFLITSDEEGPATDGTIKVMEYLQQQDQKIDWCLVGEPSSDQTVGDTLKIGRRGSLNGILKIHGKQGHIAYPHLANNAIHIALPALNVLTQTHWDPEISAEEFPPTQFQISNIHAGTGVTNVIPGQLEVTFNFRYSPSVTSEELKMRVHEILDSHALNYQIDWKLSGLPFLTASGPLRSACQTAITEITGHAPILSTSGGTSDGRFIAPSGAEVVELGPCNQTIHQINECVSLEELETLANVYERILATLVGSSVFG